MIPASERNIIKQIQRRLRTLASRAVVTLVNDSLKAQGLQITILADEVMDDVERFQNYGHTSVPLPGAEAIVLSVGGTRSHSVAIVVEDRRYRPKNLQPGDSAVYDFRGNLIKCTEDGIEITPKVGTKVTVNGDLEATGSITGLTVADALGDLVEMRLAYNGHLHNGVAVAPPPATGLPTTLMS